MLDKLKEHFQENGQISLQEFLTPEGKEQLKINIQEHQDVLMSHKYSVLKPTTLFSDELIQSFLVELTGAKPEGEWEGLQFEKGDFLLRKPLQEGIMAVYVLKKESEVCFAGPEDTALLPPTDNTLTLIYVDEETEFFVTHLTHRLEKKLILFQKII